jgi:nucleotide-binding universal stress UspA family protein
MYSKMLVPLDGSKLSEEVFPYARELAGRLGLDLVFLNVCSPQETELLPMRQFYVEKMAEIVRNRILEARGTSGSPERTKTVETIGKVVVGYPAEEILKYAEENNIDIILMSTHGYSGMKRWALGSVAYKVVYASKIPVWLARSGIPNEVVYDKWPKRTILVPLDGSKLAESALPHAEALARQRGVDSIDLLLLSVYAPKIDTATYLFHTDYPPTVPLRYVDYIRQEIDQAKERCETYLKNIANEIVPKDIQVRTKAIRGEASEEIIKYANKNPFQLIVMASHGRSGIKHFAFGSVTEKVLRAVKTPLLLIKSGESSPIEKDQEYLTEIEADD